MINQKACECEAEAHMGHDPTMHVYGMASPADRSVLTDFGSYPLCRDCWKARCLPPKCTCGALEILGDEEGHLDECYVGIYEESYP